VRCFVCRERRWPYQVDAPGAFWTCRRCQVAGPEKRAERQAVARRGIATRRQKGAVTSWDVPGAPSAPPARPVVWGRSA